MGMCIKDYQKEPKPDVWVTPGTGLVDFPGVLARLKQGGFTTGALVIETVTRPDPLDQAKILQEVKKARQYVEELAAKMA